MDSTRPVAPDVSAAGEEAQETRAARRLALVIEYEGTEYAGFQLQANEPTIQGTIERALTRFTGESIRVRGASRTDSGAHAFGQVVDFLTESGYTTDTFVGALNYYLPADVRVIRAVEVPQDFNSRRDAASRVYQYRILNRQLQSPLWRRHCYWVREPLKIEAMNRVALALPGIHDFRPLAPGHPADRSSVRQVYRWDVAPGRDFADTIVITCEANGFMQHQIRRTNAVLVEIGKGRWPENALEIILGRETDPSASFQPDAIPSLPAKGLYLVEVKYPESRLKV